MAGENAVMATRTVKSLRGRGRISRRKARSVASALRAELEASPPPKVTVIRADTTASGSGRISFAWISKSTK
jgi:hypothetical protein